MFGIESPENKIPAIQLSSVLLPILDAGHQLKIPLLGLSMFPLIVGGRDEAVLSAIRGRTLRRGDIVLYVQEDGTHVLHRIHHKKNNEFYMLGDSQTFIEGPINRGKILAVADAVVRKNKTILCNRIDYRLVSSLWLLARPFRFVILRMLIKIRHMLTRIHRLFGRK